MINNKSEFFYLKRVYTKGDLYINDVNYDSGKFRNLFTLGKPIDSHIDIVVNLKSKTCNYIDFPMSTSLLDIVSDRLKNILEKLPNESSYLQFIPVKINGLERPKVNYWLINILDNIKCFDWENSIYERFPDTKDYKDVQDIPDTINNLRLNPNSIGERNIFRMYESEGYIFVSAELKKTIEAAGCQGLAFMRIEDFGK